MPEWKKLYLESRGQPKGKRDTRPIREQRESLPIQKLKGPLVNALIHHCMLIVIGETGSGKTTQITQYMQEQGFTTRGVSGCTQPRRVQATSVQKRVQEEFGCRLGQEVGYQIRFEDQTTRDTVIKYMTDGMLLREILSDPFLSKYSSIMLDEAHERTISTDVLFQLLKRTVKKRNNIRLVKQFDEEGKELQQRKIEFDKDMESPFTLIVTSATLDAQKFSDYFYGQNIFTIPGKTFPVEISYSLEPPDDSYVESQLLLILEIHLKEPKGDILLFLTGQEEIETASDILTERMLQLKAHNPPPLIILPVFANAPSEQQSQIFEPQPPGCRKCVIATNIAEASLTIDGVLYVVDPGFCKVKSYNPKTGMDSLVVVPISQQSQKQRSGRQGRTQPGKCYRLYTEGCFKNEMSPTPVPEIQRTSLDQQVLQLKQMGINDILGFDFMDQPPVQSVITQLETLFHLGALCNEGTLTKMGRKMADFPIDPTMAKTLMVQCDYKCSDEIISILSMLSVDNLFHRPRDKQQQQDQKRAQFNQNEGDHCTLLEVYKQWSRNNFSTPWCFENYIKQDRLRKQQDVRKQLIGHLDKYSLDIHTCGTDYNRIRKTLCQGYFQHQCKRDPKEEGYKTLTDNQTVYIHPASSLYQKNPEFIIYHTLVMTTKEYLREVTTIEAHWLPELQPNLFQKTDANKISKRKLEEKIEPLYNKFEVKDSWRLSRRMG